jgi:PGF-pre-PGF domain-containing protein
VSLDRESLRRVSVEFGENVSGIVNVSVPGNASALVPSDDREPLARVDIDVSVGNLSSASTVRFALATAALDGANATADQLRVLHYRADANAWETLETRVVEVTNSTVVIEAETSGFSPFVVVVVPPSRAERTMAESETPPASTETPPSSEAVPESATRTPVDRVETAEPPVTTTVPGFGYLLSLLSLAVSLAGFALWNVRMRS